MPEVVFRCKLATLFVWNIVLGGNAQQLGGQTVYVLVFTLNRFGKEQVMPTLFCVSCVSREKGFQKIRVLVCFTEELVWGKK